MKIDLHVHSCYSRDGLTSPKSIIKRIKATGLTGIAITDHDNTKCWDKLLPLAKKSGVLVVKGEELKVKDNLETIGELSALFLEEEITSHALGEIVDQAKAQGALLFAQHPFDSFRKPWRRLDQWKSLDGVEAFNSRCILSKWNDKALEYAQKHSLPAVAGSDAHTPWEIGHAFIECDAENEEGLRKAILKNKIKINGRLSSPFVHLFSTLAKSGILKQL